MDADVHQMLAEALSLAQRHREAIFEFETAIQLSPEDRDLRMALARSCLKAGDRARARKALDALLELEPDNADAARLLETIEP